MHNAHQQQQEDKDEELWQLVLLQLSLGWLGFGNLASDPATDPATTQIQENWEPKGPKKPTKQNS